MLGFTLGLRGGWDMVILTYFVICGVSRLVFLLGGALLLGRIDERLWLGVHQIGPAELHPLSFIYGLSGSAMISATLKVPKP